MGVILLREISSFLWDGRRWKRRSRTGERLRLSLRLCDGSSFDSSGDTKAKAKNDETHSVSSPLFSRTVLGSGL